MKKLKEIFNEASLSRVFKHLDSDRPVAILTAFRGNFTYKENVKRNKELAASIKNEGYGYFFVDGHWVEEEGNNETDTSEDSIFVIGDKNDSGRLKSLVIKLMKKYDQDAVVFKSETEKSTSLLFQNGSVESIGKATANKVAQAYTKLRGRSNGTFVFESSDIDRTWIQKLSKNNK